MLQILPCIWDTEVFELIRSQGEHQVSSLSALLDGNSMMCAQLPLGLRRCEDLAMLLGCYSQAHPTRQPALLELTAHCLSEALLTC